jgi:SAM-dependent methyltransferase
MRSIRPLRRSSQAKNKNKTISAHQASELPVSETQHFRHRPTDHFSPPADHFSPVVIQQNQTIARGESTRHAARPSAKLRVLHVGSGIESPTRLHSIFKNPQWQEIRIDIDDDAKPDIAASVADMQPWIDDESCDAIWASHVLEHLARHEVASALREFRRVLTPSGFALIRSPDVEVVAQFIIEGRIDDVIYTSPAGPITPLDMLYGHGASIARGHRAMRHGTAFTQDSLAQDLLSAGFPEVRTTRTETYEVWAAAFMPAADVTGILDDLAKTGMDLRS